MGLLAFGDKFSAEIEVFLLYAYLLCLNDWPSDVVSLPNLSSEHQERVRS